MIHRVFAAAIFLFASALPPATTAAQSEDDRANARAAFQRGVSAYEAERYEEALSAFQEAYRIAPHPSVRVNMANCYVHLGRPVEALDHFERFVFEVGSEGNRAQVREVRSQIDGLREQVGEVFFRIEPEGATVTIDGRMTLRAPILDAVKLARGNHHVEVSAPGFRTDARDFEVAGGGRIEIPIALPQGAEPAIATSATGELSVSPDPQGESQVAPEHSQGDPAHQPIPFAVYAIGGATVAVGIAALVVGITALGAEGDFEDAVTQSNDPSLSASERLAARTHGLDASQRADRLALTADILGGVALAGAALTTVLLVLHLTHRDEDDRASGGVELSARVSRDGGGLAIRGRF